MKIRVVKCQDEFFWYAHMIGWEFEVIRAVNNPDGDGQAYEVLFNEVPAYIEFDDGEIIFEEFEDRKIEKPKRRWRIFK
ncbi:hypothetical protein [Bacillus cihuensis]|uniref:hypothetical protein n=1 Tax=Bacillus cihuensis TaxID=1208599 RepID=UPI00040D02FE|nr:hypothetical protein [Bacillus cihuensis]